MSRRSSHASVAGLRRGSQADALKAKRVSLKDGSLGASTAGRLAALSELREGDVFYKTERIYPSIPDYPEDIVITLAARNARETRTGSIAGINRDDTATPTESSAVEKDR